MNTTAHSHHPRPRQRLAATALGLLAAITLPISTAQSDDGIRAWISFEPHGEAVIIQGFARSTVPVKARYSLRVDAITEGGRSRSRSASHLRLGPDDSRLGQIAVTYGNKGRLEVELSIEAMDGQRIKIREFYPVPGTWAGPLNARPVQS